MLRYIQLAIISCAVVLLACFFISLGSCAPGFTPPLGGRDVAVSIDGCTEPQRGWISEEVALFGWHVAAAGEVTVRCGEIDGSALGIYFLGSHEVVLDPVETIGEFSTKTVAGHELIHWFVYQGAHPDRARYHVCNWPYNEPAPPLCFPGRSAAHALMSPSSPEPWDGDVEHFELQQIPQNEPTEADVLFLDWALRPGP